MLVYISLKTNEHATESPVSKILLQKNILPLLMSSTINDTLCAYGPRSGMGSLSSVEIRFAVPEILAHRVETGLVCRKWRRAGRSSVDENSFTFDLCCFSVHEPNLVEIGHWAAEIRVATHTAMQTNTSPLYIEIEMLSSYSYSIKIVTSQTLVKATE